MLSHPRAISKVFKHFNQSRTFLTSTQLKSLRFIYPQLENSQGHKGKTATFHCKEGLAYGTNVAEAVKATRPDATVIYVPPPFAADAVIEAVENEIGLIVCITEGIPQQDEVRIAQVLKSQSEHHVWSVPIVLVSSPLMSAAVARLELCPRISSHLDAWAWAPPRQCTLRHPLNRAIEDPSTRALSTSTFRSCLSLWNTDVRSGRPNNKRSDWVKRFVWSGGDPFPKTQHLDVLKAFMEDDATKGIVLIGEIGGSMEEEAAETAPPGRQIGHAGAIISGGKGKAEDKVKALEEAGAVVSDSPAKLGDLMLKAMKKIRTCIKDSI
ncbi:hypothetical protein Pst134EA_032350 [Puccinia striiformis f. sp. tritici]|uniref:uncharacterized protein n=1 Tax=Puccinia striiformis f. sp. tritici TaxID=168172 RepID=UPI0020072416|nr:uncharacterized protein Pst134EA_032350 [Puccinia striiformis f. sp. tritici]KAH9440652.1 hypothetical protein Pst134EA_032350 [Puccinia striiformis f. sp. tritici]